MEYLESEEEDNDFFMRDEDVVKAIQSDVSNYTLTDVANLLQIVNNKVDILFDKLMELNVKSELKKPRKVRTGFNRCQNRNRKGELCKSYVCRNSKMLCHAHHTILNNRMTNSNPYLYGQNKHE